jgi:hypothetical protein
MSDRLALAHVIEDAGIPREKAEAVATAIVRFVEGSAATKADVDRVEVALKVEIANLRSEMREGFARQDVATERLRSTTREMETRITLRLGGIVAAGVAIIVTLQHLWR